MISNAGSSSGNNENVVKVNDEFVVLNTPAVLKCKATSELEFSQLVEWFTSDGIQISAGETSKGKLRRSFSFPLFLLLVLSLTTKQTKFRYQWLKCDLEQLHRHY